MNLHEKSLRNRWHFYFNGTYVLQAVWIARSGSHTIQEQARSYGEGMISHDTGRQVGIQ
jgi:hypothetical protein